MNQRRRAVARGANHARFPVVTLVLLALAFSAAWWLEPRHLADLATGFVAVVGAVLLVTVKRNLFTRRVPQEVLSYAAIASARSPVPCERPQELVKLEGIVHLSATWTSAAEYQLRPVIQEIAAAALERQGADLGHGEVAEAVLGPEVFDLVRVERTRPENPHGPGLGVGGIERIVERLESL
jgi:hypothetical protein